MGSSSSKDDAAAPAEAEAEKLNDLEAKDFEECPKEVRDEAKALLADAVEDSVGFFPIYSHMMMMNHAVDKFVERCKRAAYASADVDGVIAEYHSANQAAREALTLILRDLKGAETQLDWLTRGVQAIDKGKYTTACRFFGEVNMQAMDISADAITALTNVVQKYNRLNKICLDRISALKATAKKAQWSSFWCGLGVVTSSVLLAASAIAAIPFTLGASGTVAVGAICAAAGVSGALGTAVGVNMCFQLKKLSDMQRDVENMGVILQEVQHTSLMLSFKLQAFRDKIVIVNTKCGRDGLAHHLHVYRISTEEDEALDTDELDGLAKTLKEEKITEIKAELQRQRVDTESLLETIDAKERELQIMVLATNLASRGKVGK
ncbi:hypothetical protein JKP88DRAFT_255453 [Tribonema minus]|uniref:Uncharacterized protein n=1 Tax=Tribonema minus TaxID=303371 RepID=A0A836CGB2_9STRA|nr:hypothetical protein JKP88DRAFT_255453 [Tribonema minus]